MTLPESSRLDFPVARAWGVATLAVERQDALRTRFIENW
jgi:hypothetical protein